MNVLFLSPHFPPNFWHFCRGLREAGANPLGLADAPWESLRPELQGALAEYYRVPDMHRHDDLVRALGWLTFRHGKLDRLDSLSEYWLETEARLRDDFNVFGLRAADMARFKRKSEMKSRFLAAGLAAARGRVCHDRAALRALVEEVGYPVVAKPDTGVGAAQTFRLEDDREVEAFLAAKPQVDYIVEEFVAGDLVTYDGLTDRQGRVVFDASMVFDRGIMEVVNQDSDMAYTLVRDIPADLAAAGRTLVEAFGVRERFFHFEFFRQANGRLVALEVNIRPPGGLTVDMWNYQNDVDLYRGWGHLLVQGRLPDRATRPWFVTWVGRKDRFRYALGGDELRRRLGDLVVHHARVEDIFSRAIGNEGFILRSPELEPIVEAAAAIRQKA
jgi:ATP-grasp domain-containing protein